MIRTETQNRTWSEKCRAEQRRAGSKHRRDEMDCARGKNTSTVPIMNLRDHKHKTFDGSNR